MSPTARSGSARPTARNAVTCRPKRSAVPGSSTLPLYSRLRPPAETVIVRSLRRSGSGGCQPSTASATANSGLPPVTWPSPRSSARTPGAKSGCSRPAAVAADAAASSAANDSSAATPMVSGSAAGPLSPAFPSPSDGGPAGSVPGYAAAAGSGDPTVTSSATSLAEYRYSTPATAARKRSCSGPSDPASCPASSPARPSGNGCSIRALRRRYRPERRRSSGRPSSARRSRSRSAHHAWSCVAVAFVEVTRRFPWVRATAAGRWRDRSSRDGRRSPCGRAGR